jgi:hypothetical protein
MHIGTGTVASCHLAYTSALARWDRALVHGWPLYPLPSKDFGHFVWQAVIWILSCDPKFSPNLIPPCDLGGGFILLQQRKIHQIPIRIYDSANTYGC